MSAETERKRAAGIYYTPGYVVDYIVRQTLDRMLDGKTPQAAGRLKILDPACGAGAFLLGAYQHLLDWHRQRYLDDDGRRRILANNLFGIDLDGEAVQRARNSLFLRMLDPGPPDCETSEVLKNSGVSKGPFAIQGGFAVGNALRGVPGTATDAATSLRGTPRRAFPTEVSSTSWNRETPSSVLQRLEANVRCGNALADDFADRGNGFDVIVGNPPYRRELGAKPVMDAIAATRLAKYRSARMDLWYYFLHRGLELLRPGGLLSFIVSAYWTSGAGAERLVASLRDEAHLDELFLLGDLRVFPDVAGRHMIVCLSKRQSDRRTRIKRAPQDATAAAESFLSGATPVMVYEKTAAQLFCGTRLDLEPPADTILAKLGRWPSLQELGVVRQGIAENPASINAKTNARFGNLWEVGEGVFALREDELAALGLDREEEALLRPYFDLADVARYWTAPEPSLRLIYSTKRTCPDIACHPRLKAHLERFRPIMASRRETRQGANSWWHLHWPREEAIWQSPKILCLQFAPRPALVAVSRPAYIPFSMNAVVLRPRTRESLDYLCGLLNSRLLWKWCQHHAKRRGVGLEINGRVLAAAPIRRIDFAEPAERTLHDEIASLARQMAELTGNRRATHPRVGPEAPDERLAAVDGQLDRLVYALYGLTGEEIAIVEDSTPGPQS